MSAAPFPIRALMTLSLLLSCSKPPPPKPTIFRAEYPDVVERRRDTSQDLAKFVYIDGEFILPYRCTGAETIERTSDTGVEAKFRCNAKQVTLYDWERTK